MKPGSILWAASGAALLLGIQSTVPTSLRAHAQALQSAQSLTASLTVSPVGGAPEKWLITWSKPNFVKIDKASELILSDGTNITTYTVPTKKYRVQPFSKEAMEKIVGSPELWSWGSFFSEKALDEVTATTKGKSRTVGGVAVTEQALVFKSPGKRTVTFFLDDKTNMVRGVSHKDDKREFVAMMTDLKVSDQPAEASLFAFTAPAGAQQVTEEEAAAANATYAQVQGIFDRNCMPCHSSSRSQAGYDLSSYEAVMGSEGAVNTANPDESFIIRSVRGDRAQKMPKNKPALSKEQIDTIYAWMKAGAKKG